MSLLCVFKNVCLCTAQDVLVYLFGESAVHLTIEGLGSVTAQELGRSVREALNFTEIAQDTFAFWLCSPLLGRSPFLYKLINAETMNLHNFLRHRNKKLLFLSVFFSSKMQNVACNML